MMGEKKRMPTERTWMPTEKKWMLAENKWMTAENKQMPSECNLIINCWSADMRFIEICSVFLDMMLNVH